MDSLTKPLNYSNYRKPLLVIPNVTKRWIMLLKVWFLGKITIFEFHGSRKQLWLLFMIWKLIIRNPYDTIWSLMIYNVIFSYCTSLCWIGTQDGLSFSWVESAKIGCVWSSYELCDLNFKGNTILCTLSTHFEFEAFVSALASIYFAYCVARY